MAWDIVGGATTGLLASAWGVGRAGLGDRDRSDADQQPLQGGAHSSKGLMVGGRAAEPEDAVLIERTAAVT
jgi:hypothetical protein